MQGNNQGIKTDYGDIYAIDYNAITGADALQLDADYSQSYPNYEEVFSYSGHYVRTYKTGTEHFAKLYNYSNTEYTVNVESGHDLFVFVAIDTAQALTDNYLKIIFIPAANADAAAQRVAASTYDGNYVLFKCNKTTADSSVLTDIREWDESPSTDANDPTRMGPQGGEFADTDPFGYGNEDIELPEEPDEVSVSGFITAYNFNAAKLSELGQAIFTNNTWTNLQNKFNGVGNPIDYIISAVEIPLTPSNMSTKNFNLGGVDVVKNNNTPVSCNTLTKRYETLDFGSITLKETWGSEKDYSGTSVSIYLPYVGVKDLDTEMVMNTTMTLKGAIDLWTGDIFYALKVSTKARKNVYLGSSGYTYRFQGSTGKQIPVGKVDNTNQILAGFGGMASMGVGLASGNLMMTVGGAGALIGSAAAGPKVSMASGVTGAIGRADVQYPYLIIKQSVPIYPEDWRNHIGAPRYQEIELGNYGGYVECYEVHAENITGASGTERAEIERLLKEGVFLS